MELFTRTACNSYLGSVLQLGVPFEMFPFTTLNEKFNVQAGVAPAPSQRPDIKGIVIGNKGHILVPTANGNSSSDPVQHKATDMALNNHIPFVIRDINNDLDPIQRAKYALRTIEEYNGDRFICYWLKRFDKSAVRPKMMLIERGADGTEISRVPFVPDSTNLNPQPSILSPEGVNVVKGQYVTIESVLDIGMNASDMTEIANAANIIYGDERQGIISEIGLVSGVDQKVTIDVPGQGSANFNEMIAVQIMAFINSFISKRWANNGFGYLVNAGATEPLFNIELVQSQLNALLSSPRPVGG